MNKISDIHTIAFDADDTLWDNETYFLKVEKEMCKVLSAYAAPDVISSSLFSIEMTNMDDYGYGAMAYTLSLVENAVKVSDGKVTASEILSIVELGRTLLRLKAEPLPGVRETLEELKSRGYQLVLFTKGELLTQENKLKRSGLAHYFSHEVIVSDKQEQQYTQLCHNLGIEPQQLMMVGNSLRSDIRPALNIGAYAVHIPFEVMWQHEVVEDFEHPNMRRIATISELPALLEI